MSASVSWISRPNSPWNCLAVARLDWPWAENGLCPYSVTTSFCCSFASRLAYLAAVLIAFAPLATIFCCFACGMRATTSAVRASTSPRSIACWSSGTPCLSTTFACCTVRADTRICRAACSTVGAVFAATTGSPSCGGGAAAAFFRVASNRAARWAFSLAATSARWAGASCRRMSFLLSTNASGSPPA
mgnify:CR=1 FL=1